MSPSRALLLLSLSAAVAGCPDDTPVDAGFPDAAPRPDATPAPDAMPHPDAETPDAVGDDASPDAAPDAEVDAGGDAGLPPDPASIAPPLDPTVPANAVLSVDFLYTNDPPVQTGVDPGDIDRERVAVLRGRVLDRALAPLPGVTVTLLDHPEYGQTLTRADGRWDLAVNGGQRLVADFRKADYLPAQRDADVPWRDFVDLGDVVLAQLDPQVTAIDLSQPGQVARGSVVTDSAGTRQATLIFCEGSSVELELPAGGTQSLTQISVRATEYTAGEAGPQLMPAELPGNSGYTYAVELSLDEAIAAGALAASFDCAPSLVLENFLGFPVGVVVPNGRYDFGIGCWVPDTNGRVIEIVSIDGTGLAEVDIDGDGVADTGAALDAIGLDEAERRALGSLYPAGQELWRAEVSSFSPHDLNWPYGPPGDATGPNQPRAGHAPKIDDPCEEEGSVIEIQNGVLGESIGIAGTRYKLHYRSDRTPGWLSSVDVQLTGPTYPASLRAIEVSLQVAGSEALRRSYSPAPDLVERLVWDRRDVYGRLVQGAQPASAFIDYIYPATYQGSGAFGRSFGQYGDAQVMVNARGEYVLRQRQGFVFESIWDARGVGLGGWSIDVHHVYDTTSRTLYMGDGRRRAATNLNTSSRLVTGNGQTKGDIGDGGPAIDAPVFFPTGIAFDAEGKLYFTDSDPSHNRLRVIDRSGIINTIAGGNFCDFDGLDCLLGDNGPADQATLGGPIDVAIGDRGEIYVADSINHRIRVIEDGMISTFAGSGPSGGAGAYAGEEVDAKTAMFRYPSGVAVGPDCALFVSDTGNNVIRKIDCQGIVTTIAGTPEMAGYMGDGGPASAALLNRPQGLHVDEDGTITFADADNHVVRRITPDGIITTIAGTGTPGSDGDDDLAVLAALRVPSDVTRAPDGTLYVADQYNGRLRRIDTDGVINTVWHLFESLPPDGAPGVQPISPAGVAIGRNGGIYITDPFFRRVLRIDAPMPGFDKSDIAIASSDARELYRFDSLGRHLSTIHLHTGGTLYTFGYDAENLLTSITDRSGLTTTITRTGSAPAAIVAPFGQQTTLSTNADGYLESVTDPVANTYTLTYQGASGLLATFAQPDGATTTLTYDVDGRLLRDAHSSGQAVDLEIERLPGAASFIATLTTAENRESTYEVEILREDGYRQLNTGPDGNSVEIVGDENGFVTFSYPDGTLVESEIAGDPRFGMQAPYLSHMYVSTGTPISDGLIWDRTVSVALDDPTNPLSLLSLLEQVDTSRGTETRSYDAASRTWTYTSRGGRAVTEILDAAGRVVERSRPSMAPAVNTYNAQGQLVSMVRGTGPTQRSLMISYDTNGYISSMTDAVGRTFTYENDDAGRVVRTTLPDTRQIAFTYDGRGNVVSITPPSGNVHQMSYRTDERVAGYTPPSLGAGTWSTAYTYNNDGQITRADLPGGITVERTYDNAGRAASLIFDRGTINYTYDSAGRLGSANGPGGENVTLGYFGPLLRDETWSGTVQGSVGRTYANGFEITQRTVNGANPITFTADADGLYTNAGAMTLARDQDTGVVVSTALGNVTDTRTIDPYGELATYTARYQGTTPLYDVTYTRDGAGRITEKVETIGGTTTTFTYGYEAFGRLATVTENTATTHSYNYDVNGNRLGDGMTAGTYDAQDRLLSWGAATYTYSDRGTLTSRTRPGNEVTTYTYDALGSLTAVELPDGTDIEYIIDPAGRRVGKRVNGALVRGFLYQNLLAPIAELDGSNAVVNRFVYASRRGVPDYMIRGGVTYRILSDALGSVRLVVNTTNGTIAQRLDYGPFGEVLQDTSPGFQPFGYAGGLYDPDTGLVRFGARDYDPELGRWTAKDPIGFGGGDVNLYGYVFADPINRVDKDGRIAPLLIGALVVSSLAATASKIYNAWSEVELAEVEADVAEESLQRVIDGEVEVDPETAQDLEFAARNAKQKCRWAAANFGRQWPGTTLSGTPPDGPLDAVTQLSNEAIEASAKD